ncbi:MAG: hypothetical protein RLZZ631_1893 [Cyanobacteriota bacterium]
MLRIGGISRLLAQPGRSISTAEDRILPQITDCFPQVFRMGPSADSSACGALGRTIRKTVLPLTDAFECHGAAPANGPEPP